MMHASGYFLLVYYRHIERYFGKIAILSLLLCTLLPSETLGKTATTVRNMRLADRPEFTRFVLDLTAPPNYQVSSVTHPERLVIDVKNAKILFPTSRLPYLRSHLVTKVRYSNFHGDNARIVLDLSAPIRIKSHFLISPREGFSYRLVIDLIALSAEERKKLSQVKSAPEATSPQGGTTNAPSTRVAAPISPSASLPTASLTGPTLTPTILQQESQISKEALPPSTESAKALSALKTTPPLAIPPKRPLVMLDPGHGGEDPGAIGTAINTYEKKLVLHYAFTLKKALEKTGRYRVLMTRDKDIFIPLNLRVEKAQKAQADLFISFHADSHPSSSMQGLSVYTLSENASDKEAERLATQENKFDALKGMNLTEQNTEIKNVLIDLAQRDTKNTSAAFAERVIKELARDIRLVRNSHRFAGFRVLKGVEVPAVLIELGYLSNPQEERQLNSWYYQQKIITSLLRAIETHFPTKSPTPSKPTKRPVKK